jgi:hypothetical protein
MWDLWWTKRHWSTFFPSTSDCPANHTFHRLLLSSWTGTIGWRTRRTQSRPFPRTDYITTQKAEVSWLPWTPYEIPQQHSQYHWCYVTNAVDEASISERNTDQAEINSNKSPPIFASNNILVVSYHEAFQLKFWMYFWPSKLQPFNWNIIADGMCSVLKWVRVACRNWYISVWTIHIVMQW